MKILFSHYFDWASDLRQCPFSCGHPDMDEGRVNPLNFLHTQTVRHQFSHSFPMPLLPFLLAQDDLIHVAMETGVAKSSIISGWRAEERGEREVASAAAVAGHTLCFPFRS